MEKIYDLVIIGSGPAGLSAAIYAQRAKLETIIIEKEMMSGGQVLTTYEVDNYPGLPGLGGFDLGMKFRQHADSLEAKFVTDEVVGIEEFAGEELQAAQLQLQEVPATKLKRVDGKKNSYVTKTVLVATGATHRHLGVEGETKLSGMGVSYCATCDGAFFKKKVTAVIGGGDVALEDAIFLARMCAHVYLIHRRGELRGAKSLQEKLFSLENVTVLWDTVVDQINGEFKVESLSLTNVKTKESSTLEVQGVFVAVGITPNSKEYVSLLENEDGYICADETGKTSEAGIFVAGDVRTKQLRQITTAVSDGANAITSIEHYLMEG